jgi:regulation of enolase protein 1 (concanavalin A-like superfamily)
MARRAVEQRPGHAKELAPLFDSIGQHEHAARLLQVAQAHTLEGDCRYESESDTYTLVGWGTDISGRMDEFHFAYKTLEGNGSIIARIESIEDIHPCAKAGVMIRQNLDPGAQFAGAFATSGSGVRCDARLVANEKAISDFRTAMSEQTALRAPVWVRIERKDDQFGAFYSSDGKRWTRMAGSPQKISMPQGVYIGLAVTSHDRQKNAEAQFSHVAVAGDISYSAPFEDSQDICFHPPSSPDAQNSR